MELPFTHKPGRRERHLKRRHENPLFGWPPVEVEPLELLAAQKADHEDMEAFQERLQALVQRAIDLPPDAGSDLVLTLKGDLERQYEEAFALPEDHARERDAIRRLIALITQAVRRSAGADPLAQQELGEEDAARAIHFRLLEHPLVADILHPESLITPDALTPSILAASLPEVEAALDLFDRPQIEQIAEEARTLLEGLVSRGLDLSEPRRRVDRILARLVSAEPGQHR